MNHRHKENNPPLLDMRESFISEASLPEYKKIATYCHFPKITDELVLAVETEDPLDGKKLSLLIYESGLLHLTELPLKTLFIKYGCKNKIRNWSAVQKTFSFISEMAAQLPPYVTVLSGFIQINPHFILNLNKVHGYKASIKKGQLGTHTVVVLCTGATVEIPLGITSFRTKLHEAAKLIIALRSTLSFLKFDMPVCDDEYAINDFILTDLDKYQVSRLVIDIHQLVDAFVYFNYLQKMFVDDLFSVELLTYCNSFIQNLYHTQNNHVKEKE